MRDTQIMDPACHVREFTQGAGHACPDTPQVMTREDVDFIG